MICNNIRSWREAGVYVWNWTTGISRVFDSQQQMIADLFDLLTSFSSTGFCLFTVWSTVFEFILGLSLGLSSSLRRCMAGKASQFTAIQTRAVNKPFVFTVFAITRWSFMINFEFGFTKPCLNVLNAWSLKSLKLQDYTQSQCCLYYVTHY